MMMDGHDTIFKSMHPTWLVYSNKLCRLIMSDCKTRYTLYQVEMPMHCLYR